MINVRLRAQISLLVIPGILSLSGCSAFVPAKEEVRITASQPGADVYINDEVVGQSPVTVQLYRNDFYTIYSSSDPIPVKDGRRLSFTGALDIAGAVLVGIPLIGWFTPGFWTLDSDDVHLNNAPIDPEHIPTDNQNLPQ